MGIPVLWFRLEGPLQSWGERSKWDYRDTALFPTKSGIVGLLSCALGYEREDERIGHLSQALTVSVRADRPGELLTVFHTVSSERLLTAEGKTRSNSGTIISHRSYLQDASFLVALTSDAETLAMLKAALDKPKWQMYLGRKSCVPTVPLIGVLTDEYDSLDEAMRSIPLAKRSKGEYIMIESDSTDESGTVRADLRVPDRKRAFMNRKTAIRTVKRAEVKQDVSVES